MEQNKVTRSDNPVTRATSAINKALEGIGNLANQVTSQAKGPTTGQALAQALTQPMGDTPKPQSQPPPATVEGPKPFEFDWPGARIHVMEQVKAELAMIEQGPFMDPDFPKLTVALLFKVATELAVLNRQLGQRGKVPKKSAIIRP